MTEKITTRKSFIIHKDSLDILEDLTDEQAGQLFKTIWCYQTTKECEISSLIKVAFNPFKHQFDRDDIEYQKVCVKNKSNGSKGGRPKNPKNPVGYLVTQKTQPNPTEPDNKNKNKNDSKKNKAFELFWNNYPKKTDKKKARLSFGRLSETKQNLAIEDCRLRYIDTDKKYIPNASTYLNGERWEDEKENEDKNTNFWGNLK
jgi:hypothetical protein